MTIKKREQFNKKFDYFLGFESGPTIVFNNDSTDIQKNVKELFETIKERGGHYE